MRQKWGTHNVFCIDELPERLQRYQLACLRDCDRGRGECSLLDALAENGECRRETAVLTVEIGDECLAQESCSCRNYDLRGL